MIGTSMSLTASLTESDRRRPAKTDIAQPIDIGLISCQECCLPATFPQRRPKPFSDQLDRALSDGICTTSSVRSGSIRSVCRVLEVIWVVGSSAMLSGVGYLVLRR